MMLGPTRARTFVRDKVLVGQYTGKFHESLVDGLTYRFVQDLDVITPIVSIE
jgi:hypothetical protein